jgi:surface carbohydrate biosynthesis protein
MTEKELDKWMYVPIEVKVRELEAKVLFSATAVKHGYNVLLGSMGGIKKNIKNYPNGVYVSKDMYDVRSNDFKKIKEMGHKIVSWDEEGLIYINENIFLQQRFSENSLRYIDRIFTWGKNQKQLILSKVPNINEKIINVGNPRIDILKKEYRDIFKDKVKKIYDKYGEFILINSNFGFGNHVNGIDYIKDIIKKHTEKYNEIDDNFYNEYYKYNKKMFEQFKEDLKKLSNSLNQINFILRPHPSENFNSWKQLFSDFTNVKVVHKGNVVPWIMASELVIHNSCTTGIESVLLNKPTISYMPIQSEEFDIFLPNEISQKTFNLNELINLIDKIIYSENNNNLNDYQKSILEKYIFNYNEELSSEKIIEVINQIDIEQDNNNFKNIIKYINRNYFNIFRYKFKDMIKQILEKAHIKEWIFESDIYSKQKFGELTKNEIISILNRLKQNSDDFNKIKIKKKSNNLFELYTQKD